MPASSVGSVTKLLAALLNGFAGFALHGLSETAILSKTATSAVFHTTFGASHVRLYNEYYARLDNETGLPCPPVLSTRKTVEVWPGICAPATTRGDV